MTTQLSSPARRRWLARAGVAALATQVAPAPAVAPPWPTQPLRLLVPQAPGEGAQIVAQAVAAEMARGLGQPVGVEHLPGAGGGLALQALAQSDDGHTLVLGDAGTLAVTPLARRTPSADALKDLAPISLLSKLPLLYVAHPDLPVRTLQALLTRARAQPGQISYGSTGPASTGHLAMEYLKLVSQTFMLHVPYRDLGAMLDELMTGQLQVAAVGAPVLMPLIRAGRLRCLATGTATRLPQLPDVPTVAEQGHPGFEMTQWQGLVAPRAWPRSQFYVMEAQAIRAVRSARVRALLAAETVVSVGTTGAEFGGFIQAEQARWKPVIARARIQPEAG